MKSMWMAFFAILLLAVAADFGLKQTGWSTTDRATGNAVRLQ